MLNQVKEGGVWGKGYYPVDKGPRGYRQGGPGSSRKDMHVVTRISGEVFIYMCSKK